MFNGSMLKLALITGITSATATFAVEVRPDAILMKIDATSKKIVVYRLDKLTKEEKALLQENFVISKPPTQLPVSKPSDSEEAVITGKVKTAVEHISIKKGTVITELDEKTINNLGKESDNSTTPDFYESTDSKGSTTPSKIKTYVGTSDHYEMEDSKAAWCRWRRRWNNWGWSNWNNVVVWNNWNWNNQTCWGNVWQNPGYFNHWATPNVAINYQWHGAWNNYGCWM